MNRYSLSSPLDRWGRLVGSSGLKPQYLGFSVGSFRLGIPLLRFAEVRNLAGIAPILRPPDYRCGQAVVYGQVVSLLDLRVELGCPAAFNDDTRILFAWRRTAGIAEKQVGLIVDSVDTVLGVDRDSVEITSEQESGELAAHVLGVAIEREHRRVLVDLDRWIID